MSHHFFLSIVDVTSLYRYFATAVDFIVLLSCSISIPIVSKTPAFFNLKNPDFCQKRTRCRAAKPPFSQVHLPPPSTAASRDEIWIERPRQPQASSSWSHRPRLRLRLCSTTSSSTGPPYFFPLGLLDRIGSRPPVSWRRDGRNSHYCCGRQRHPPDVLRRVSNGARRPPCCGSWSVAASCASQLEVRGLAIGQDSVFCHPLFAALNSAPSFTIFFLPC
jgi:hypothetical protein